MMSTSTVPAAPPVGSTKLTGTLIGTAGSYQNAGNTIARAMDGSTSTFFDAPPGVQGWVGLNLGTPETVTQVQFVPRSGFASRMAGGIFQGSSTPDFSSGVTNLYTITSSPAGGVYTQEPITVGGTYQYVRYLSPATGSGNIAELEFDGIAIPPVPVAPTAPTSISATGVSASDVHLSWSEGATSTVTSFTIERQGPTDATYVAIGTTTSGSTTSYDDLTASPATPYSYEVIANNSVGSSPASLPATLTTPLLPVTPLAPTSLSATAVSATDVHLSWQEDPSSVVTSFTLERQGPTDATYVVIGTTTSGTVTTFDDLTANANTAYSYEVIANNNVGPSAASTPATATTPAIPLPLAPTGLSATALSVSDLHLTWTEDPSSIVTSFTIERQGPTDPSMVVIGSTTSGSITTFDDSTAAAATLYSYEVIANNVTGPSVASAPATITTPAVPVIPVTPPPTSSDLDIGAVGLPGSAKTNANGSITLTGSGADIWNTADAFNFDSQSFVGNGSIITQVTAETNDSSWAKSGIMMRETLNDDSRYVLLALTPGNGVTMQARTATHVTPTVSLTAAGKTGVWLEMVRSGSSFSGYVSTNGTTWTLVGTVVIPMANNIQGGLAVTAHNNTTTCTATFSNIAITPAGTQASAWSDGATGPIARWESEDFSYNGLMYVFGGYDDRTLDATTECDAYNPAINTWSNITTMPNGAITHAAVTLVGDTVYIAGGNIGSFASTKSGVATATISTYDLTTGVWGSAPSLPVAVTSGGMVCINNHLIYYGGINAASTVDQSATYSLNLGNPSAGWVTEAAMPNARNHIGYAAVNGIAYAIGGLHLYNQTGGNVAEVDAYNPVTNTWSQVASLPMPWAGTHSTTLVVNGKIVIIGGQTNGGYDGIYLNNIEEFDPVANAWAAVGTLPEANQGEAVAYINGDLIVAGGTVDNQGGWAQDQVWLDTQIIL